MAKQRLNTAQQKITRNNNGSVGAAPSQKEEGWINVNYAMTSGAQSGNVTFLVSFISGVIPIVSLTFAADSSATGVVYGSGGNVAVGGLIMKVTAVSNTGFSWFIHSRDALSTTTGSFVFTYVAEG